MRSVAVVVAFVACLHACAWAVWQSQASAPNVEGVLDSVSYSPFTTGAHPDREGSRPSEERIRAELKAIAPYTKAIRLYSSTGGVELVPRIANDFGLKVTLGIWLDKRDRRGPNDVRPEFDPTCKNRFEQEMGSLLDVPCTSRNIREITSGLDLLRKNRNVNALMVGNETIMRRDLTADELAEVVKRIKREVNGAVPVSTGEISAELLKFNEDGSLAAEKLVSKLDFVAAHILPYWGRVPATGAVDEAVRVYETLRKTFPGKHIVLAEFGWPSSGYNRGPAMPGKFEQATIMRSFVERAQALGIDYNLIEAYDQPWKTIEGSVGAYWGVFDNATHQPKFPWSGPINDTDSWKVGAMAVTIGALVSLPILGIGATLLQAFVLAIVSHGVGAWGAAVLHHWNSHYFVAGAAFAFWIATLLLIPLVVIALGRINEIAAILFGRPPARLLHPNRIRTVPGYAPKVSIHIPAYREPPEMLKATLDAVARLDYPDFECIIVINNTPDPAMWQPVEEHCKALGDRFRFVNAPRLDGYKAGALRLAMTHTSPSAEIIGIIDSDYAVTPDWLRDLVPAFADLKVGLVQAPQDHRDGARSPLHHVVNGEYAGFFEIGMVQRNEANAIIVHGTMCLIRRSALEQAGGWSSDTICEDTDLGLTIIEHGWQTHYTNRRYGYGLLPDTFEAYKKQRDRWASGGLQIAKKHWRRFLPGASLLTPAQKREFAFGWVNWLGAELLGVLVAILNLIWVPVVTFADMGIPDKIITLPIIATFALSITHFVTLYLRRVPIPVGQATGAMFAAMSMHWTVACAVANGILKDHLPFVRTAKGGSKRKPLAFPAFYEAVLGGLLAFSAALVFVRNVENVREINLYGTVLAVQSLPFLAATALAAFETSRLNDFALWHNPLARLAEWLPRELAWRRTSMDRPVAAPKKQMEAAQ